MPHTQAQGSRPTRRAQLRTKAAERPAEHHKVQRGWPGWPLYRLRPKVAERLVVCYWVPKLQTSLPYTTQSQSSWSRQPNPRLRPKAAERQAMSDPDSKLQIS